MSLQASTDPAAGSRSSVAGWLLLAVLVGGVGLRQGVVHPGRNYLLDFRAYYAAGKALRLGINPYDIETVQARIKLPGRQPVFYCPYPPPALSLMVPFGAMPYPAAQIPWCLFQYALAVAALVMVLRASHVPLGSPVSVLITTAFLLSGPVFQLFRWGQFDMIVLALLAAAILCATRDRSVAAGVLVGLAALAKVTPCVLLGVFLIRRDFKALGAGLLTIVLLLGASYPVIGAEGFALWYGLLTEKLGEVVHIISPENMSLHGFVYRALIDHQSFLGPSVPWINLGPAAAKSVAIALVGAIGFATVAWMIRHRRALSTAECLAAFAPVILLVSPITWMHHCVLLLLPIAVIVARIAKIRRPSMLDLGWIVAILLCLTMWPVQRFQLELPAWLSHGVAPTTTYAVALTWLFMIVRLVPLKHPARAVTRAALPGSLGSAKTAEQIRENTALG